MTINRPNYFAAAGIAGSAATLSRSLGVAVPISSTS